MAMVLAGKRSACGLAIQTTCQSVVSGGMRSCADATDPGARPRVNRLPSYSVRVALPTLYTARQVPRSGKSKGHGAYGIHNGDGGRGSRRPTAPGGNPRRPDPDRA